MNKKNHLTFFTCILFLFNSTYSHAQNHPTLESLENNPDVIWIGEIMVDYSLSYNPYTATKKDKTTMKELGIKSPARIKTLKLLYQDLDAQDLYIHHIFREKIIANLKNIETYKDPTLTHKHTAKEVTEIITIKDTITSNNKVYITTNALNPADIKLFRVNQLLYYNQKEMVFKTIPLAIAPLLTKWDLDGTVSGSKALFWFSPKNLATTPDLNSNSITWAKRTYKNFELDKVLILKEELPINQVIDKMLEDLRKNSEKVVLGHTLNFDGNDLMKPEEVEKLYTTIDTVTAFDSNSLEKITLVVKNALDGSDIKSIRILQDWVWDADKNQLGISSQGFAPIIIRSNREGGFMNSGPIFTRRVGRDRK